jgi:hypothetical protein
MSYQPKHELTLKNLQFISSCLSAHGAEQFLENGKWWFSEGKTKWIAETIQRFLDSKNLDIWGKDDPRPNSEEAMAMFASVKLKPSIRTLGFETVRTLKRENISQGVIPDFYWED